MFHLLKKEINSFLGSLTGYIAIIVFLAAISVFMWIIPGESNILDNGYARLDTLFIIAPWVFLFLVPAITMRSFAEEKRTGTLEILLTGPLTGFKVIMAKYLAGCCLVAISLLPTLLYWISVYMLGIPAGNIDNGGTSGSYFGLLLLGVSFVAIGIFSSATTGNQAVAFITAALLSFIFYVGFDSIGDLTSPGTTDIILVFLSINRHYVSMSRGVIDSRDILFFISLAGFFILLAWLALESRNRRNRPRIIRLILFIIIIILLNFISGFVYTRLDLTAEKRFSLTSSTKNLLRNLNDKVFFKIYLEGDLPSGFRRLRDGTRDILDEFRVYSNGNIEYQFINPSANPDQSQRKAVYKELIEAGIQPTTLQIKEGEKVMQNMIFPGAIAYYREKETSVPLLQSQAGAPPEIVINNSVELLEYGLAYSIKKLTANRKVKIGFLEGQGELDVTDVQDIMQSLAEYYEVQRVRIDGKLKSLNEFKTLVIAGPDSAFSEKDKFILDQFIMRGGNVLFLMDGTSAAMDSLAVKSSTIAIGHSVNLEDQMFRYGTRINSDLIQDIQCASIPINTAMLGNQPQWEFRPWLFFPLVLPGTQHPVVNNLDVVKCDFASTLDTVSAPGITKTPLLVTSRYTRVLNAPVPVDLHLVNNLPPENLFNKSHLPVALLLEGEFESVFKNRITPAIAQSELIQFKEKGLPAKIIVVSDKDVIRNQVSKSTHAVYPLGYDRYTDRQYGNKNFIQNAVDYLCDDSGLISVRSKELKIRMLDHQRILKQRFRWQAFNTAIPVVLVILMGIIINWVRKRKFA